MPKSKAHLPVRLNLGPSRKRLTLNLQHGIEFKQLLNLGGFPALNLHFNLAIQNSRMGGLIDS